MPSTWLRWGVDANGDGVADPWNPTDAVFSAARYLAAAGGTADLYRGVFAYNHADWYVKEVLSLADLYGGNSAFAFSLDHMQQNLDAARAAAAHTGELVIAAEKVARRESRVAAHWQARAAKAATALRSARARAARRPRGRASRRGERPNRKAPSRPRRPAAQARTRCSRLRRPRRSIPPPRSSLSAPSYSERLRLPGRRRPERRHRVAHPPRLSRGRHRGAHGRPALCACRLRRRAVLERAGSGLRDRPDAPRLRRPGLDVLPPVGPRPERRPRRARSRPASRSASSGATGDATGPHLHLQLQPATAWPQQEAWFLSFAGTAFTWRDADSARRRQHAGALVRARRRPEAPVFRVISAPGSLPRRGVFQPRWGLGSVADLPTRRGMASRLRAHLPRVALFVLLGLAATATLTYAAGRQLGSTPPASTTTTAPTPPLVVPDVRNQAFVFAKGSLEDAGFAWRVLGSVHGYAANTVAAQSPAAGTRVLDTGAPLITLTLKRNSAYPQTGEAADASPYAGTVLAAGRARRRRRSCASRQRRPRPRRRRPPLPPR